MPFPDGHKILMEFILERSTNHPQSELSSKVLIACNAAVNSKVQHPPRAFELLKIGLFKFPSLGAKKPFTVSHRFSDLD